MQPLYLPVIPSLLGFFVLFAISAIALFKGWKNPTNRLFACIAFLASLINADVALISIITDKDLAMTIDRLAHMFFIFSPPVYIQFVHYYLNLKDRKWLEYLAYFFTLLILLSVPSDYFISGLYHYDFGTVAKAGPIYHVFSLIVFLTLSYCLKSLYAGMKKTVDNLERTRIKYIFAGMGGTAIFLALNILPISGFHVYPMSNFSFVPALLLAYGFLKYDLLDVGLVLRKGTIYLLLTFILTIIYIVIIGAFNFLFLDSFLAGSWAIPFLLAILMVWIFNPLRNRLQYLIDMLFYKGKYDYQQILEEISADMTSLLYSRQIRRLILNAVFETLRVSRVCLLLAEGQGNYRLFTMDKRGLDEDGQNIIKIKDSLSLFLESHKTPIVLQQIPSSDMSPGVKEDLAALFAELDISLLVPMYSHQRLYGALCLGQKKSGELFVQEDMALLSTLSNHMVIALENARSYESLELLNRELESKVDKRTLELRRMLEEKEKTQNRLIQSESLAAIGQLVAGTAHELNNPLTSAQSLLQTSVAEIEMWSIGKQRKEEVLDDLKFSLKELKRASEIVRSLLGVSRQSHTYKESVDINKVLEDTLRILNNQYKYLAVDIVKRLDERLPPIFGNFANLSQVMINIIQNAIQSLQEGKGIITLATSHNNNMVVVEISDTGRGMAATELKDIFKPFYTTKQVGEGIGLGLYISHALIERHNGQIYVESEIGKGSTFRIELPTGSSNYM